MPGAGFTYRRKGRGVGLARWQDPDVGRNIGEQREPTQENKQLPNPAHVICILVGQKMQIIPIKGTVAREKIMECLILPMNFPQKSGKSKCKYVDQWLYGPHKTLQQSKAR